MSAKSERKKRVKAEKQQAAAEQHGPRSMYAEDVDSFLADHRKHCKDPKCDERALAMRYPAVRTVVMLYPNNRSELFLCAALDGQKLPLIVLKLANPDDIAPLFHEDGSCDIPGCDNPTHPLVMLPCCHPDGSTVISVEPGEPGAVTLRCNDCGDTLSGKGFPGTFKLAPRPKAERPYIYCAHHGLEPAYIICKHIVDGVPVAHLLSPDPDNYGQAMCEECAVIFNAPFEKKNAKLFAMSCASGVNLTLGGKLDEKLKAAGQPIFVGVLNMPTASATVN